MEKYRFVMREIGVGEGMLSADGFAAYLEENIAKGGYKLAHTDSSDIFKDGVFVGKRVFMVFVRELGK